MIRRPFLKTCARWGSLYLMLFCLGLTLGACAAPKVDLRSAALTKVTTTGLNVMMNMNVNNPNSFTIPLSRLSWDLKLFRTAFNQGALQLDRQIAKGNNAVSVPLGMRFKSMALGVQKFASGQSIPWDLGGQCNFNTRAGNFNVKYGKSGTWANPLKGKGIGGIRLGKVQGEPVRQAQASFSITLDEMPLF